MNFIKTFLAALLAFVLGSLAILLFGMFILFAIAGSMERTVTVKEGSILRIDFSEVINDAPSSDPLAGFDFRTLQSTRQLSLLKVLRTLEAAAVDDRIEGIYLRMNGTGGVTGTALIEELREAIELFKQSGKFVVAYNETYSQGQYYLASAADRIYLQPEGGMDWSGLSTSLMFYKGLFDKLDLKAEVFRPTVCKYKSAVEPYILDRMSEANREQMQALVDSMWGTIAEAVAASRGIDVERLNEIADKLQVTLPEDALKYGFVDGLLYEDQMKEVFAELGVEDDGEGNYDFVSLGDYASMVGVDLDNLGADRVAVVYADGQIVDGEGYGDAVYGNSLAAELADVRRDEKVKAVVVRVNSPGGSALASDVIWREMELLRAEKPVVVSMGSYAASGGYYISCPADVIVADRLTLTGSIGVFGMFLNPIDALKNKLGITLDGVKSNASAGMGSVEPLTPAQRASIMRGVDKVYETFTQDVAAGRNLPIEKVLDIAGGRVWSGSDALGIGLIDAYGGLKTAIALAVDKAGLGENFRVVEVTQQPSGLAAMLSALNVSVRKAFVRSELQELFGGYDRVQRLLRMQGVLMYSPYEVELR
ncbi:signal peptide peptidase SppA [Alistipes sp. CAG:268]|jgi:protease-4|uniref:signal peptide peptidase SppA n=1 Tax=Alistipes sp. CAG:268 TaxID=1262693 RepID=UPI00033FF966|nr:signal peptide peptidase SppA [Alistipes sp. CAG:268]CDC95730.1 signal peptide peptidase SppA 67K type [Alistipes sp. CAG:268]HIX97151.1 signal peptide peptidase SppA [Candidatus Alistipes avistercoris]